MREQRQADHRETAAAARAERGAWARVFVYRATKTAHEIARLARLGQLAYGPAGDFEAYAALVPDGAALWVRYVGGDDPVPPSLPDRMTVRVPDYGSGPDCRGVRIVEVDILPLCRICGGPRGFDRITPDRFQRDGAWHTRDRWDNPCGHKDLYEDVVAEARSLALRDDRTSAPVETDGGLHAAAVQFLVEGAAAKRFFHAKQASAALAEAGHTEAAEIIRAQLSERRGCMSAKQAAHHLHTVGGGGPR